MLQGRTLWVLPAIVILGSISLTLSQMNFSGESSPPPTLEIQNTPPGGSVTRDAFALYLEAKAMASRGDPDAIAAVQTLEQFLGTKGLTPADLQGRTFIRETHAAEKITIQVEGVEPIFLKLSISADELKAEGGLESYLSSRRQALHALAVSEGKRELQFALTFNKRTSIERLWQLKDQFRFRIDEILLDVFEGEQWLYRYSQGPADRPGGPPILNGPLNRLLEDIKNSPLQQRPKDNMAAEANLVRITLPAELALEISELPDVLLVDPIDQWREMFTARAAVVHLAVIPNPFMAMIEGSTASGLPSPFKPLDTTIKDN